MAPLERIKLLKQLQHSTTTTTTFLANKSTLQLFQHVYLTEGLQSFWRGNTPAVLRVAGTAALNFSCLEYYKQQLRKYITKISRQHNNNNNNSSHTHRSMHFWTSLVAGGMAGATSTTIMYPLEFARTRLALDMGKDPSTRNHHHDSSITALNKRTTTDSSSSWKAQQPQSTATTRIQPPQSSTAPSSSTTTSSHIQQQQPTHTNTTSTPSHRRQYTGMIDVLRQITKSDGPLGLYRGYGIALVGGIFYRVLYLGGYDALKHEYAITIVASSSSTNTTISWWERLLVAQSISLTAGTLSYPFDSVRRRMMMQAGLPIAQQRYTSATHCIQVMWRTEGLGGFYRGLAPNILRSLGGALLLVGYDTFQAILA